MGNFAELLVFVRLLVAVCVLLVAGCTDARPSPVVPPVSRPPGPDPADREVVLDVVALPTSTLLQTAPSGQAGWLFAKNGLVVRSSAVFDLVVAPDAAGHARIGWSNVAPPDSGFHLPGCSVDSNWVASVGGYYVEAPACVPLIVRSAGREALVGIPVGAPCPTR